MTVEPLYLRLARALDPQAVAHFETSLTDARFTAPDPDLARRYSEALSAARAFIAEAARLNRSVPQALALIVTEAALARGGQAADCAPRRRPTALEALEKALKQTDEACDRYLARKAEDAAAADYAPALKIIANNPATCPHGGMHGAMEVMMGPSPQAAKRFSAECILSARRNRKFLEQMGRMHLGAGAGWLAEARHWRRYSAGCKAMTARAGTTSGKEKSPTTGNGEEVGDVVIASIQGGCL